MSSVTMTIEVHTLGESLQIISDQHRNGLKLFPLHYIPKKNKAKANTHKKKAFLFSHV